MQIYANPHLCNKNIRSDISLMSVSIQSLECSKGEQFYMTAK